MNHILEALQAFTSRESLDITLLAEPRPEEDAYPPLKQYVLELSRRAKPETAADGLFQAVARDVIRTGFLPQVHVGYGFVDYLLTDTNGAVALELKPLFHRYSDDALRPSTLKPSQHLLQVKKYLHQHEYVILTDLKDAYLFSARDTLVDGSHFARLPFTELLERQLETGSFLDVLRRLEDNVEKPGLDRQFFADLRDWYRVFERVQFLPGADAPGLIILLINKLVFVKTLEDYGLIAYRFLQNEYERLKELWDPKGPHRTLPNYLKILDADEFLEVFYDTELFSRTVWPHVERSPANIALLASSLEKVLGVARWDQVFARGVVHYNYRRINEDIFGRSYEMFLAANRKDEGIYYTPAAVTAPMADGLADRLFGPAVDEICACVAPARCDFARAGVLMDGIAQIRVADTAAGSGGFLIKVLRAVWRQYARLDAACGWVNKLAPPTADGSFLDAPPGVQQAREFRGRHSFDQPRVLISRLLLRHLFAVDKDAGALEVAKTNLWQEAVKLSPYHYNFRRLKADAVHILPNLSLNFLCADSLVDVDAARQTAYLCEYSRHALGDLARLREAYLLDPGDHAPLHAALDLRAKLRANLAEHFQDEPMPAPPAFLALEFFPCWFEADGALRPNGGFDGLIGNPPWEAVKPVRKEFAQRFFADHPHLGKYGMDGAEFERWMAAQLAENDAFRADWEEYQRDYTAYKTYLAARFEHQGAGDVNYFKLFLENNLRLVRRDGQVSNLVPSGLQTDEGCAALRRWLLKENTLAEITSFENKGYLAETDDGLKRKQIFPDVHPQYKFSIVKAARTPCASADHTFDGRFYLHDPKNVCAPPIKYSLAMLERFSPQNFSIMEFRTPRDYELCTKIRADYPLLGDFGHPFRRELHMTEDAHFFRKRGNRPLAPGELPLYEGKMIYQFDTHYAHGTFYVLESEVRVDLLRKELFRLARFIRDSGVEILEGQPVPKKKAELDARLADIFNAKGFKLQYEVQRLAYRKIGRSTDERTLFAALISPQNCLGESLNYLSPFEYEVTSKGQLHQHPLSLHYTESLTCLLNSFVLNYYIRNKISANVSIFQLNELPIPPLSAAQRAELAASAQGLARLSGAAQTLAAREGDLAARARLEAFVARDLYGLSAADWRHLTGTFTYGGDSASKADLDEIIRLASGLAEGW